MSKKKLSVEKVEKVIAEIPWSDIVKITGKLVSYSRGGITREEAKDLAKDLLSLANKLTDQSQCEV